MLDGRLVCVSASFVAALAPTQLLPEVRSADVAPMRITSCRTVVEPGGRRGPVEQTIHVSFSNDREAPADIARFVVLDGSGEVKQFTAHGSFSKGVIIADRILPAENPTDQHFFSRERGADCALTYVHFVDGSSWTSRELKPVP